VEQNFIETKLVKIIIIEAKAWVKKYLMEASDEEGVGE
jgi:hypothetical protein